MPGMRSHLLAVSALALLAGCPTLGDDDDVGSDCPVDDRFTSDPEAACTENFCGAPQAWPGTGSSVDTFRVLEDGDSVPIYYGDQGGYHIDLGARMQNLCPVVFLDFELYAVEDGEETLIHNVRRHVQAVRENSDPEIPSIQRWWVEQFRFPCTWWPEDPENDPFCGEEPFGQIDAVPLKLVVGAEDHNEDRRDLVEVNITAECCL